MVNFDGFYLCITCRFTSKCNDLHVNICTENLKFRPFVDPEKSYKLYYQSTNQPTNQSIHQSITQLTNLMCQNLGCAEKLHLDTQLHT